MFRLAIKFDKKKISNDQELVDLEPNSRPQIQKANRKQKLLIHGNIANSSSLSMINQLPKRS